MIILYEKGCEGCKGNRYIFSMKAFCNNKKIEFENRNILLSPIWEKEAETVSDLEVPFFYSVETGKSIKASMITDKDMKNLIAKDI